MIRVAPKFEISTLDDLIKIANSSSERDNPDIAELRKIKSSLHALNGLIGMDDLKKQIVYQVMFYIQKLNTDEMMHTALMGPPGVGKTTVAKILASIYKKLGFLSKGKLIVVNREDLIGQYLGETAIKTRSVLEHSKGNVLFIDEAYSLGSGSDHTDTYAKECVDTLTGFLSENTKDFICIIAGYEKELQRCFFAGNPGLDRRFPWKYTLDSYKPPQLCEMFQSMLKQKKWKIRNAQKNKVVEKLNDLLKEHSRYFSNNGGDVQNFINSCMMAHSKRVFGDKRSFKKFLVCDDIERGFALYKSNKKGIIQEPSVVSHMYL